MLRMLTVSIREDKDISEPKQTEWTNAEAVSVCRRAAAEISQTRSCGHQGAVIIPVSLLRQWRASQRAGREKSKTL